MDTDLTPYQRYHGLCSATITLEDLTHEKRTYLLGLVHDGRDEAAYWCTRELVRIATAWRAADYAFRLCPFAAEERNP